MSIFRASINLFLLPFVSGAAKPNENLNQVIIKECEMSPRRKGLRIEMIDDGFCDCANGIDEPSTDACAGQGLPSKSTHSSLFYCKNQGSQPKYIYSSHVNDGVCDCCDGSDESSGSTCQNSCAAHGAAYRQKKEKLQSDIQQAKVLTQSYVTESKEKEVTLENEINELTQQESDREVELLTHKENLQKAEKEWMDEQLKAAPKEEAPVTSRTSSTTIATTSDATEPAEGATAPKEEEKKVVSEYAKWMDKDAGVGDHGNERPAPAGEAPASEAQASEDSAGPSEDSEDGEAVKDDAALYNENDSETYKRKMEVQKVHDEFVRRKGEVLADLGTKRNELESLKKYKDWYSLIGKCLELATQGYTYKLCFFTDAKQDWTSLGRFKDFVGKRSILFEGGDMCPGGPARSVKVDVECGLEAQIISVSEPERCGYQATMTHPAACTDDILGDDKPDYPTHYQHADEL